MAVTKMSAFLEQSVGNTTYISRSASICNTATPKVYNEIDVALAALTTDQKINVGAVATLYTLFIETNHPVLISFVAGSIDPIRVENFISLTTNVIVAASTGLYVSNPDITPIVLKITAVGT